MTAQEYNKNISHIPEIDPNWVLTRESLIIRLYKYETESKTSSGLITPAQQITYSKGGEQITELSKQPYKTKGIIVKLSDTAKTYAQEYLGISNLEEGMEIFVDSRARDSHFQFIPNRDTPVQDNKGYFKIALNQIELLTGNKLTLTH